MIKHQRLALISMSSFRENVRVITYGDDLWMSVKDEVKDIYNAKELAEVFASYDIKFTNSLKGKDIIPYTKLEDPNTTFLKCTFHHHDWRQNIWVARLDERAALEICNWTWKTNRNIRECSITACQAMCESLYGHGEEKYESIRGKVIGFWREKGVFISIPDWRAVDMRIYND